MPFATRIVPMPHWSTPLGCTKLFLTIIVLAFIIACTAIWGWYPAFDVTIFSATLSLLAFGYYLISLCFKPRLYNKWLVLCLETVLTLLWFVSLILLAGWTGASSAIPRYYYTLTPYTTPYGGPYGGESSIGLSAQSLDRDDLLKHSWEPFKLGRRQGYVDVPRTLVRVHGSEARYAAQILAGISAGLAGFIFIMYAVTLTTYTMNFYNDDTNQVHRSQSTPTDPNDEEMQLQTVPPRRSNTSTITNNNANVSPPTPTLPVVTTPLNNNALPKDFEPKSQGQEFYLGPAEATEARIEPPSPVLRVLRVERERESEVEMEIEKGKDGTLDGNLGNEGKSEGRSEIKGEHKGDVVRGDGRIEREV